MNKQILAWNSGKATKGKIDEVDSN